VAGAAACALGAAVGTRVPATGPRSGPAPGGSGAIATLAGRPVLAIWLSFVCVAVTYGASVSFSPLLLGTHGAGGASTFLLVFGLARTLSRTASGRVMDRVGDLRLVLPACAAGAAALALLPLGVPALTIVSAAVFGAAFGVIQTGAFVGLLSAAGPGRSAAVSGIWSMAMDAGYGSGTLVLAPVGAAIGYARMFWLLPGLFVLSLLLRLRGRAKR